MTIISKFPSLIELENFYNRYVVSDAINTLFACNNNWFPASDQFVYQHLAMMLLITLILPTTCITHQLHTVASRSHTFLGLIFISCTVIHKVSLRKKVAKRIEIKLPSTWRCLGKTHYITVKLIKGHTIQIIVFTYSGSL